MTEMYISYKVTNFYTVSAFIVMVISKSIQKE